MIIAVIYLLGAIHGFILALVLARKKINKLPNKLLALLMVVFSVDLGMAAFLSFELHEQYPNFIGIDYPITLLYGPLVYLYVKTLRDGSEKIRRIDYLHFVPFVMLLLYLIPFYTGTVADKIALLNNTISTNYSYSFQIINHVKVIHGLVYVAGVIYMLISYRKKLKHSFSSIEKINLSWLQHFITAVAVLAFVAGSIHFFASSNTILIGLSEVFTYDDITLLATTVFVYGIGYMGLHQPEVFSSAIKNGMPEGKNIEKDSDSREPDENPREQYQKSGLNKQEAESYTRQLNRMMENKKLYRNSDLKLADLAEELEISPHNLTEVINRYIGQNFYDFINSYRVEEVKRQLNDPRSENITLLAVALDAGFNSKSTFNAVFKKQTGMTPSQFRRQLETQE